MCLDREVSGILIAKKDIPVFKIFRRELCLDYKLQYVSPYQHTDIKKIITRDSYGYYSYTCITSAKRNLAYNEYICKLYIPKGTKYILGYCNSYKTYRSEYLKSKCQGKIITIGKIIKFKRK